MDDLDRKLNDVFSGKVVRKDLTKRIREGASVPVYVLEACTAPPMTRRP